VIALKYLALTLIILATAACEEELTFAPELGIDLSEFRETETGLYIREDIAGAGLEATAGDTAYVHYTAWFVNGVLLDTSRDANPFRFVLDADQVIDGFDEGVTGMRTGGQRTLVILPGLGYGHSDVLIGETWIPGGTTLVYEVELVDLRPAADPAP